MELHIRFSSDPIGRSQPLPVDSLAAGARVDFFGTVRELEAGAGIRGLRYEIYESMAEKQLVRILCELEVQYPCEAVAVVHRSGEVLVGEAAVYVGVTARHRAEAFGMLSALMNRLKREVPIWKAEVLPC
jgi:molybdopterin synthase catalytic subunit